MDSTHLWVARMRPHTESISWAVAWLCSPEAMFLAALLLPRFFFWVTWPQQTPAPAQAWVQETVPAPSAAGGNQWKMAERGQVRRGYYCDVNKFQPHIDFEQLAIDSWFLFFMAKPSNRCHRFFQRFLWLKAAPSSKHHRKTLETIVNNISTGACSQNCSYLPQIHLELKPCRCPCSCWILGSLGWVPAWQDRKYSSCTNRTGKPQIGNHGPI